MKVAEPFVQADDFDRDAVLSWFGLIPSSGLVIAVSVVA